MSWTAIVPVKAWQSAKSRLDIPGDLREELARALTLDTLDVLVTHAAVGRVVVVTADPAAGREARVRGAIVLDEAASADPLNDAVRQGCASVADDGPTVVVPVDMAYLSTDVLATTLAALAKLDKAHVPDLRGTGTTLLAASRASEIDPQYGVGSSSLHSAAGFTRLDGIDPRARTDIDDLNDLESGWAPGPRVAALIAAARASSIGHDVASPHCVPIVP